jgi:hypothetical protein
MKIDQLASGNGILSQVPGKDRKFLIENASAILNRTSSLEAVLKEVSTVFKEKEYGWEEAILSGKWFRYPSEVGKQRFCSEEALKNYLMVCALGIPAQYAITENLDNRGMAHELVLIPNGSSMLCLDWNLSGAVVLEKEGFRHENGKLTSYDNLVIVPEEQIIERVEDLRSGLSFLDAISCSQQLYQIHDDKGLLESYVHYDPEVQKLAFQFIFRPYAGFPFYYEQESQIEGDKIICCEHIGLVGDQKGRKYERMPMLTIKEGHNEGELKIQPFWEQLSEQENFELAVYVSYDSFMAHTGRRYLNTEEERADFLRQVKQIKQDAEPGGELEKQSNNIINIHAALERNYPHAANVYLDYQLHAMSAEKVATSLEELHTLLYENKGIMVGQIRQVFVYIYLREFGKIFEDKRLLESQRRLTEVLGEKTGNPYKAPEPGAIFNTLQYTANLTRDDFWE